MSDFGDPIFGDDPDPTPCDGATWRAWQQRREHRRIRAEREREMEEQKRREREERSQAKQKTTEPQQKRLRGVK